MILTGNTKERFWAKVIKTDNCWLWTAGCNQEGYAYLEVEGSSIPAARVSFEIANSISLSSEEKLRRVCGNPRCVNPDHLSIMRRKQHAYLR